MIYKNKIWIPLTEKVAEFIINAKTKFENQQKFIQQKYSNKTIHGYLITRIGLYKLFQEKIF